MSENEAQKQDKNPPSVSLASILTLQRHLSTIGIEDVFLEPPSSEEMLPKFYLNAPENMKSFANNDTNKIDLPCEIVGRIKSDPEDFIVREISLQNAHDECTAYPRVADIIDTSFQEHENLSQAVAVAECQKSSPSCDGVNKDEANKKNEQEQSIEQEEQNTESLKHNKVLAKSPLETISGILHSSQCVWTGGITADGILASIQSLQEAAVSHIKIKATSEAINAKDLNEEFVWVPPLSQSSREMRGQFHRALKVAFPLLCSETTKKEDECSSSQCDKSAFDSSETQMHTELWIRVSTDYSFVDLAPFLYQPEVDLQELYCFRNRGFFGPEAIDVSRLAHGNGRGTKRRRDSALEEKRDKGGHVVLHLRENLPRDERRKIHHAIAKGCKDFETSTNPTVPIPKTTTQTESGTSAIDGPKIDKQEEQTTSSPSTSSTTAAIIVKWSKRSQQTAFRKRQRRGSARSILPSSGSRNDNSNILCVVKKRKKEHLAAIQHLTTGIRCRQSEIGLAGIKDMQAVTYQFCTIKNSTIKRVRNGNNYLKRHGIEVGSFRTVKWTLNHGDLEGNQFELIVRDVSRVKTAIRDSNSKESQLVVEETFIPCRRQYAECAVERIRRSGFINFYGEQRLGVAGGPSEVGVRSFDIGRAMIQCNFGKAVDLIMEGRLKCSSSDYKEESAEIRKARERWKESGGDASATLKALPRGEAMARERTVLKGLKRYGKGDPLSALKCLHFGVRQFYINAFQSFVWNKVASERIKRFGSRVVQGDLYISKDNNQGNKNDVQTVKENNLTEVDLSEVVLPLPGYNIRYPENEIGRVYDELLKEENVIFEKHAPPEATAKGSYRHLIAFAKNLEAEYTSTIEICSNSPHTIVSGDIADKENSQGPNDPQGDDVVKSIRLSFDLRSGSYATMMLRELMFTTMTRENMHAMNE